MTEAVPAVATCKSVAPLQAHAAVAQGWVGDDPASDPWRNA